MIGHYCRQIVRYLDCLFLKFHIQRMMPLKREYEREREKKARWMYAHQFSNMTHILAFFLQTSAFIFHFCYLSRVYSWPGHLIPMVVNGAAMGSIPNTSLCVQGSKAVCFSNLTQGYSVPFTGSS